MKGVSKLDAALGSCRRIMESAVYNAMLLDGLKGVSKADAQYLRIRFMSDYERAAEAINLLRPGYFPNGAPLFSVEVARIKGVAS